MDILRRSVDFFETGRGVSAYSGGGVVANRSEIDVAIDDALTSGWTLSRLEILLQAILRAGAYELCAQPDVPTKVIINEYLEIAHAFFAGKEPSLVNAVLDCLASRFRGELEARRRKRDARRLTNFSLSPAISRRWPRTPRAASA